MSSIIQRNIVQLGKNFLKSVNYIDIDYRGYLGLSVDPTIQSGQVMVNDLKIWLQSSTGDYYRRLAMGGFFDSVQKYPLSIQGASDLSSALRTAINSNFPTINILNMQVTPDLGNRAWNLQLVVQDTITAAVATVTTSVQAST